MDFRVMTDGNLLISFLVNGVPVFEYPPEDSEILLDPRRVAFGPIRSYSLEMKEGDGPGIAYIDNVRAVHVDRS